MDVKALNGFKVGMENILNKMLSPKLTNIVRVYLLSLAYLQNSNSESKSISYSIYRFEILGSFTIISYLFADIFNMIVQ